jgi:hypothetical protein
VERKHCCPSVSELHTGHTAQALLLVSEGFCW